MVQNKVLITVGLLVLLGFLSVFTVEQTQKALLFRLGEIVGTDFKPGLHFKIPYYNVKKFDARILTLFIEPERFLTSEKKNVIVDVFVKWRIGDTEAYYVTVGGDPMSANLRLSQIIKDEMRGEFGKRTIRELVSTDRQHIQRLLLERTTPTAEKLGIKMVDCRILRIDLPSEVSSSVYRRMEAERARVAREFRSQGAEKAEAIRADAEKQREVILAEAFREAEKKRGEGDAIATDIYAKAYGRDTEFFSFYRSINAYKEIFKGGRDMILLEPDSDFFRYFKTEKTR